jgi:hypothetical protein
MPIQLAGTISDTGETFVSDQGGKSWTIINPDAVFVLTAGWLSACQ